MLIEVEIILTALLVVALLVMSILDFALSGLNKIALRRIAEDLSRSKSSLIDSLADARDEVLMAIHITIQTLLVAIAVLLTGLFLRLSFHHLVALPAAAGTTLVLVLVFRQLVPRAVALRHPEVVLKRLVPVLGIPYFIVRPIVRLIMSLLHYFHRWEEATEPEEEEEASDEEIQAFIDAGQEEGILEQDEGVMIQSIVQFGDKVAMEVMTPRTQIVAADVSWDVARLVGLIVEKRHTRIPVFRDELDNIEGIVHERDLLRVWKGNERLENLRPLVRPVHFIPETKPIDDLLQEMKERGQQIVLVVDEYGGISGLITIEDLVEEIVGEIHDGADATGEQVLDEGPDSYLVPGSMDLGALDAKLGTSVFADTESTTVGGAVVELFGRLPAPGERIRHEGMTIEVVDTDRRKIRSLRLRGLASRVRS